jgi:PAS domain S-box-containing protein
MTGSSSKAVSFKVPAAHLEWAITFCVQNGLMPEHASPGSRTSPAFIDWDHLQLSLAKLSQLMLPQALQDAGEASWHSKIMQIHADTGRLLFSVKDQYLAIYGPRGLIPNTYPLKSAVVQPAPGVLEFSLTPIEGHRVSEAIYHFLAGQMKALPGPYRLPYASISTTIDCECARFLVTHREPLPGIRSLLRYTDRKLAGSRVAIALSEQVAEQTAAPSLPTLWGSMDMTQMLERLNSIVGPLLKDIYWLVDDRFNRTWVSDSVIRQLGYKKQEFLDLPWRELMSGHDIEALISACSTQLTREKPQTATFQVDLHSRRGERIRHEISLRRIADSTLLMMAAGTTQYSTSGSVSISNETPEAVLTLNSEGAITWASPAACELLGYDEQELLTMTARDFLPEAFADNNVSAALHSLSSLSSTRGKARAIRRDRTLMSLEITLAAQSLPDGTITTCILRDLSHQEILIQDRNQLARQLETSQKLDAIGQLSSELMHDFNNLLVAINGYVDLAEQTAKREDRTFYLSEIRQAADRGTAMTRRLLSFSREKTFNPELVDLGILIQDIRDHVTRLIPPAVELKINIASSGADSSLPTLADRIQIEQVLLNLVINARDAMPAGGRLLISAARQAETSEILLSVADTGTGMDASMHSQIFNPLFTTKPDGQGTGLGLTIVRQIVEQHNGSLEVESAPGLGSRFSITLPIAEALPPKMAGSGRETEIMRGSETVLLVEDDERVRVLTRLILTAAGYKVIEAGDGKTALALFRDYSSEIDLALLDVMLPGKGGLEVAEDILQSGETTALLFMSGYSADHPLVTQIGERHWPLIKKPFGTDDLRRAVEAALNRKELPRSAFSRPEGPG